MIMRKRAEQRTRKQKSEGMSKTELRGKKRVERKRDEKRKNYARNTEKQNITEVGSEQMMHGSDEI